MSWMFTTTGKTVTDPTKKIEKNEKNLLTNFTLRAIMNATS